ncbi:MAG: hypothetical protein WB493_02495 [Anaeromyxobacteraceae bacterium]
MIGTLQGSGFGVEFPQNTWVMVTGASATTDPGQILTGTATVGLAWDADSGVPEILERVLVDLCYQDATEGADPTIIPFNGSYPPATNLAVHPGSQPLPGGLPFISVVSVAGIADPGAGVRTTWNVGVCVKNTSARLLLGFSTNGWFAVTN